MKNISTVMRLARSIRHSAEKEEEYDPDLCGWCAVTSNILFVELCRRGIQSKLTWNGSHCFLIYGRYLIDITATQFDASLPKVVKRLRSNETRAIDWWREEHSKGTMKAYKRSRGWATSDSHIYQDWQRITAAHLKTLK